ncbi:hypothetical protein ACU4GD_36360 [Cupriavidus basilensis]
MQMAIVLYALTALLYCGLAYHGWATAQPAAMAMPAPAAPSGARRPPCCCRAAGAPADDGEERLGLVACADAGRGGKPRPAAARNHFPG